ncbi:Replication factor C subunit 5 [Smittium mucronatum]|uniref:Replication factor C subunit 5 n=1 Tax=Smittium mucronatum TaxID=133383 RepID=A0A1R0GWM7_9FUNG|nr:Replication factor C subunit 5 [Smittium mucronatum]
MALWVDKDRPNTLEKLTFHQDLTTHLIKMVSPFTFVFLIIVYKLAETSDIPHLMFYGPEGSGKKTRIMALLRQIFGAGAEKIRMDTRSFSTPSSRTVEINMLSSNYHIEINPSDAGIYDRIVVQELVKEIAQTQQVNSSAQKKFKSIHILYTFLNQRKKK